VLRRKIIDTTAFIKKKSEKSQIPQPLSKQEQVKPKSSRWKEIIKIRSEINEMEMKRLLQRINKTKS
jgi:hypothetical protein